MIAFIGSVFSPYYAWSRRRDPANHVAVNVALYGDGWQRWAMTERGRGALSRGATRLDIGPSGLAWEDDALTLRISERSVPHLAPLRGTITLRPRSEMREAYALDAAARHWWRPIAPAAEIAVDFERPGWRWSGAGYFDMNWGAEPLEDGFRRWDWSRAPLADGGAAVLYDATRRDGSELSLALRFDGKGGVQDFAPPPRVALPASLYRMTRCVQSETPDVRVLRRLEDAPFYTRSELATRLLGEDVHAMHESLDADRFATRWVRAMLPWRMPRLAR